MNGKTNLFLMIYNLLGIALCLIGNIYLLIISDKSLMLYVGIFFMFVTIISTLLYVFSNCKKEGAMHLRRFLHFYAFSELISIFYVINLDNLTKTVVISLFKVTIFVLLITLSTGQNLGKEKSLMLIRLVVVINLVLLVSILFLNHGMMASKDIDNIKLLVCAGSNFALSMSALLCMYSKYVDKENRRKLI